MPIYFGIGIVAVVILMMTAVFPVWHLFPKYVTEQVKVISVDQNGCIAETQGGLLVNIGKCTANPGELIQATYDANIFQRLRAFLP